MAGLQFLPQKIRLDPAAKEMAAYVAPGVFFRCL